METVFPTLTYEIAPQPKAGHVLKLLDGINEIEATRQHAADAGQSWTPSNDQKVWERLADTLEELHAGPPDCPTCKGAGHDLDATHVEKPRARRPKCPSCHGTGRSPEAANAQFADLTREIAAEMRHLDWSTWLTNDGIPPRFAVLTKGKRTRAGLLTAFALDGLARGRWRSIRRCRRPRCRVWFLAPTKRKVYCKDACRVMDFEREARQRKVEQEEKRRRWREQQITRREKLYAARDTRR